MLKPQARKSKPAAATAAVAQSQSLFFLLFRHALFLLCLCCFLFGKSYAKIQMEMQQKRHEKCCKESRAEDKVAESCCKKERKRERARCLSLSLGYVLHLVKRGVCVMPAVAGEGERVELPQLTSHLWMLMSNMATLRSAKRGPNKVTNSFALRSAEEGVVC